MSKTYKRQSRRAYICGARRNGDEMNNTLRELFSFIKSSPTAFHTVETVKKALTAEGYTELPETEPHTLRDGGKYFVTRNGSSLIAFRYNEGRHGFMMGAAHGDSPAFRVKASLSATGAYTRLDVEKYGGMIYSSWLDRPLSVAGRVFLKSGGAIEERLVDIDRDLLVIPSVAVHLNRGVNDGYKFNPAVDMLPLLSVGEASLSELLAKELGAREEDIVGHDVFVYNREEGRTLGASDELVLAPRLDDLACVFALLKGFLEAEATDSVPVFALFDNEEVGSETKQGAASSFLHDVLSEIAGDSAALRRMTANGFMVSADNAHARHPNHSELSDAHNAPLLNGGIVIKYNANQRYATDGFSAAIFAEAAERADARVQNYSNRADILGGSTLGSIADTRVSVPTVDVGLPQLAMHSASECMGAHDIEMLAAAMRELYSASLVRHGSRTELVKAKK